MKYTTPEVSALGDASNVIRNGTKAWCSLIDPENQIFCFCPAYGLDE